MIMRAQSDLKELQAKVTKMITDERNQEIEKFKADKLAADKLAQEHEQRERKALQFLGVDPAKIDALEKQRHAEAEKLYKETEAKMNQQMPDKAMVDTDVNVHQYLIPSGARSLTPSWTAGFSTQDMKDTLVGSSGLVTRGVLTGGACQDYWNWASGGGWGCFGSGVGSNQQWVEFGFWFLPDTDRFYSVMPHFQYRGYYIVQADDGWFTCKNARCYVTAWTNCYQYNWKGWNSVTILDRSGDNINENNRLDVDRYPYSSYLLGGGDWAFIRCTIGLYVRAQGDGSYAKNDFSTGNANYLCVPDCYVW